MTGAEKFALAMALWTSRHTNGGVGAKAQWEDVVGRVARVATSGREHTTFLSLCYANDGGWRFDINPFTDSTVPA